MDIALKMNMPSYFMTHAALAMAYGQLGERDAAARALRELLAQKPDFDAREAYGRLLDSGELLDHSFEGLRKAGLAVEPDSASGSPAPATVPRQGDKHAIVVLPFVSRSPDADNEYFSDGLTEEISTDLAAIKALRVISRTSALHFKGTTKDIATIGRELGVQLVLEGSVRKAGASLRITARLVDAHTDEQLWADKYSGTMDEIF